MMQRPGVGEIQGGFGSASFRQCLGRLVRPYYYYYYYYSHSYYYYYYYSATCPLWGRLEGRTSLLTNPPQVMSPNLDQIPPQDSASMHDPPTRGHLSTI